MPHRPEKLLQDAVDAAEAIRSFLAGKTLDDFRRDLLLRSGVERQFEIIGEALTRLGRTAPTIAQMVSDFPKIVAFRSIIAHGYDVLDPSIVWDVGQNDLPKLLSRVQALLADLEGHPPLDRGS